MMDDILHLTVGARFTHDKKDGSLFTVNGATPSVNGVTAPRLLNASWSRVDPMVNLALDASQDVHLYGKWSTATSRAAPTRAR
jgi:iron complex outermembrane receptor protein